MNGFTKVVAPKNHLRSLVLLRWWVDLLECSYDKAFLPGKRYTNRVPSLDRILARKFSVDHDWAPVVQRAHYNVPQPKGCIRVADWAVQVLH